MGQLREANETLIFQHIPKTAGTTLSFILTRHFQQQDIYHIRNLQQLRGPAYSKHFSSAENQRGLTSNELEASEKWSGLSISLNYIMPRLNLTG